MKCGHAPCQDPFNTVHMHVYCELWVKHDSLRDRAKNQSVEITKLRTALEQSEPSRNARDKIERLNTRIASLEDALRRANHRETQLLHQQPQDRHHDYAALADTNADLKRQLAEASLVLAGWERAYELVPYCPGFLGLHKYDIVANHIHNTHEHIESLRREVDRLVHERDTALRFLAGVLAGQ